MNDPPFSFNSKCSLGLEWWSFCLARFYKGMATRWSKPGDRKALFNSFFPEAEVKQTSPKWDVHLLMFRKSVPARAPHFSSLSRFVVCSSWPLARGRKKELTEKGERRHGASRRRRVKSRTAAALSLPRARKIFSTVSLGRNDGTAFEARKAAGMSPVKDCHCTV